MNYTNKQRHHNVFTYVFLVVVAMLSLSACSTKKNTFVSRSFHNVTSHFNVYWNGNNALEEGYKEYQKNVKDNYTAVLPVYNIGTIQEAGQMSAAADRALEKGSMTIQRHSMHFGKREYCKWIDDTYLMMGKAYFYKREYVSAKRTFEFIMSTYDDPNSIFEAHIWLIHTMDKAGNFNLSATELELARLMLDQGQVKKRKHFSEFNEMAANHYILLQEYDEALPYLKGAIQYAQSAKMRQRLQFITAQIYQNDGNYQKASEYYQLLAKKNTTFDIGFNSRINLAKCYAAGSGNTKSIVNQLGKMLKETKNEEYKDQIYYALYEVAHASKDREKEKEYLQLSVANSTHNDYQKSLSALTLATMLFEDRDYENSQAYYDTTLQVLPNDYPNYEKIKERGAILSELVENLVLIRDQDSLQRVAKMSESERNAHIDKIIRNIIEEEKRQEEEERRIAELNYRDPRASTNTSNTGSWYFYNPQTVTSGRRDFLRKFGTRKLEDLWIVSNKQSFSWGDNHQQSETPVVLGPDGQPIDTSSLVTDVKKREYYMQFLPMTAEQQRLSDSMIAVAYFNAGSIYREKLHENKEAADQFKMLIERYPDPDFNKKLLLSYYFIIKCYHDIGDNVNKQKYIDLLTSQYPNSDIAKLILDPEYYRDMEMKTKSVESLYEKTYLAYTGNQFYVVIINADKARSEFPNHDLIPKFNYLRAMSAGKIESKDSTVAQLSRLIEQYPNSEVRPLAETVIASLTGKAYQPGISAGSTSGEEAIGIENIYNTNIKGQQFFSVYLPDVGDMNAVKIRLNDFNTMHYKTNNLTVNGVMLDTKSCLITVGIFGNQDAAMKYYHHVMTDDYVTRLVKQQTGSEIFVVTTENYSILYQNKDMVKYNSFFEKYYLQK